MFKTVVINVHLLSLFSQKAVYNDKYILLFTSSFYQFIYVTFLHLQIFKRLFFFLDKKPSNAVYYATLSFLLADYGFFKINAKTRTDSGVKFTTTGSSSSDTGKVNGSLETEYEWSDYGKLCISP